MFKRIITALLFLAVVIGCQESMQQRAARDAREVTEKKCPMPLTPDGKVVLESIEFDMATLTWRQHYQLRLDIGDELDVDQVKPLLLEELKNTPSYKPYMDSDFNFQYIYVSMSNPTDTIINLTLTPQDYR